MFPPILTNRTLNSTTSTPLDDDEQQQHHSCSLSPIHTKTHSPNDQFELCYTCPEMSCEQSSDCSDCSDYVDDDWSSIEDGDNPRTSREAQEAEIEDKYRSALNFLQEGNIERAVSIFSAILFHPIMAKYHVSDWSAFDWEKALATADTAQRIVPNMAKLFFNINLAMSGLAKEPFQFYVQALSIRPDFKDLWFNCGQSAIIQRDWRSAAFCMTQCQEEFRALEALLLIHYFNNDYLRCTNVLQQIFDAYPEHQTGHIIRRQISESSTFWAEYNSKIFPENVIKFPIAKSRRDEVLQTLDAFQYGSVQSDDQQEGFTIFRPTSSIPIKWAPLVIKLESKTKMEQLGKLLCDIFDRINEYSSFVEQSVTFEFEELMDYYLTTSKQKRSIAKMEKQLTTTDGQSHSDMDDQMEPQEGELSSTDTQQPLMSDEPNAMTLLEQIAVTETEILENQNSTEGENGDQQPQQNNIISQNPCISTDNEQEPTTIWNQENVPTMPEPQDEIGLRRSTRLVDDFEYFRNSNKRKQTPASNCHQMDALTLMGFDEKNVEEHQTSVSDHRQSMQFQPDAINTPRLLSNVDELIAKLVEQSSIETAKFPDILYTFLVWVAFEQHPFVVLTLEEVESYRDVYGRWSTLFNMSNCSFTESDLAIHQLAAELGSHRALSILQAFYGRRLLLQQQQQQNLLPSSLSQCKNVSIDGPTEEPIIAECCQLLDIFCDDISTTVCHHQPEVQMLASIASDENALFRWVCNRIQLEQQQNGPFDDQNDSHRSPMVIERNGKNDVDDENHLDQPKDCLKMSTIRRQLEVRYKWLIANLLPDELCLPNSEAFHFIHTYSQLSSALALMEPEWTLLSHAEFDISCLTVRNLTEVLRKRVRQFQLQQIDYLIDAKRFDELRNVLLHQYDWSSDSEDAHIRQKFLMIQCIRETDNSLLDIGEWVSKILNELSRTDVATLVAKRSLRRCLQLLDELFPVDQIDRNASTQQFFTTVGYSLGKLLQSNAPHEKLKKNIDLWRWCYKISKFREGEQLSIVELKRLYERCTSANAFLDLRRFPTKTTMLLARGHEMLGKAKKCSRNEGMYLRLLIDEFLRTSRDLSVRCAIAPEEYKDIRDNTVFEIMQCLRCCLSDKFGQSRFRSNRVVDHGSKLQWPVDWAFAAKVLELIIPSKLPDICSDRRVPSDLSDLITKAFDHLLTVDSAQLCCLDELLRSPFPFELEEKFDSDGLCCGYEERLQMGEEGRTRLEQLKMLPMLGVTSANCCTDQLAVQCEQNACVSEFSAKCIYLLAHYHYRTGTGAEGEWLRKCLAIGGAHLPRHILASAWYALGRSLTYEYAIKNDEELLDRVEAYVFPFKMALFLHWEFAESHLDVATIIYQLRTRFARFKMKREVNKELRCKAQTKIEGMLLKCKVHFFLALRFNDSPKDVAWLSNYFLAKIAEKLGEQPEKVLSLYYHCALALEEEGIQYLTKINRVKQTYFEPLEIHYKVHAYALRYLRALNSPSFPPRTSAQCAADLANIHAYLTLFSYHGVQRRCLEDGHWSMTEFYDQSILQTNRLSKSNGLDQNNINGGALLPSDLAQIEDVVHSLICAFELQTEIVQMCRKAFDAILFRFPHYKAYYRVARAFFDEKNFTRSTDILFDKLFLTGRKQRCNNFLENIVEIKRTDFERNGSFPYHLCKIVHLAASASFKCGNIGRLKDLVVALTAYKPSSSSREILGESMIRDLLAAVLRDFKRLVDEQQAQYGHDIQHLGKLIEQMEVVIGKLKRDGRCQKKRNELETTLIACIQRRDKISQQSPTNNDEIHLISSTAVGPKFTTTTPTHIHSHHQLFQQQRHHFIAQHLPIGLKSPTTPHNQLQQQQSQVQTTPTHSSVVSALLKPLPAQFMLASSSSSSSSAAGVPSSSITSPSSVTANFHHELHKNAIGLPPVTPNSQQKQQQKLKPLDSVGIEMLQKILPTLDLDRHGLGVLEKFRIIQALFERMGYEFPRERAEVISRKINEPHNQQHVFARRHQQQQHGQASTSRPTMQQRNTLSPSTCGTHVVSKNLPSTKSALAERQRMTGLPPNAKPKCKIRTSALGRPAAASGSDGGGGSAQFGPIATPKIGGDGPPTKIWRKENDGSGGSATGIPGSNGSQFNQSSSFAKNVITLNDDDDISPIRSNSTNAQHSNAQKTSLASPRQNVQKQMHNQQNNTVGSTYCKNILKTSDPSPMPMPSSSVGTSTISSSVNAFSAVFHPDQFAGLPPSALSSMLAALTTQLRHHQRQQQQQQQKLHGVLHNTNQQQRSPLSTSLNQQHQLRKQQQQQHQSPLLLASTIPTSSTAANAATPAASFLQQQQQQPQPDLLLSHLMNWQTMEQLRQRFGLNRNNGGSQQK